MATAAEERRKSDATAFALAAATRAEAALRAQAQAAEVAKMLMAAAEEERLESLMVRTIKA